jgi:glycosyltransferase involved in cell wall biosynthesis
MRIERRIIAKLIFDRIFGDRILKDAARCIAVSEYELRQYAEMGIKRETVDVIYNGIDTDAFHDLPEAGSFKIKHGLTGRKMVLYLGKITPRKGIDFLVKAFAMLGDPDAMLVIAGNDMGYRRRIEVVVREKGVGARVLFTGLLTGRDKLAAYVDADVLAYPAVHEIFGLVPFEAIMCGTPVIVTDDCGCGEIIGRENLGIVVKYGDVPGLTRALTQTLDDKAGAEARTRRAREFVMRALDWPLIAKKHIALYEKVLHK